MPPAIPCPSPARWTSTAGRPPARSTCTTRRSRARPPRRPRRPSIVMGSGNQITTDVPANLTLWVLGADGSGNGHATLTAPAGFANHGTIRLQSQNQGWTSQVVLASGALLNAPDGRIESNARGGGAGVSSGAIANAGRIIIDTATIRGRAGANHLNVGFFRIDNTTLILSGASFTNELGGVIGGGGSFDTSGLALTNRGVIDLAP